MNANVNDPESRALQNVLITVDAMCECPQLIGGTMLQQAMIPLKQRLGQLLLLHCNRTGLRPEQFEWVKGQFNAKA